MGSGHPGWTSRRFRAEEHSPHAAALPAQSLVVPIFELARKGGRYPDTDGFFRYQPSLSFTSLPMRLTGPYPVPPEVGLSSHDLKEDHKSDNTDSEDEVCQGFHLAGTHRASCPYYAHSPTHRTHLS